MLDYNFYSYTKSFIAIAAILVGLLLSGFVTSLYMQRWEIRGHQDGSQWNLEIDLKLFYKWSYKKVQLLDVDSLEISSLERMVKDGSSNQSNNISREKLVRRNTFFVNLKSKEKIELTSLVPYVMPEDIVAYIKSVNETLKSPEPDFVNSISFDPFRIYDIFLLVFGGFFIVLSGFFIFFSTLIAINLYRPPFLRLTHSGLTYRKVWYSSEEFLNRDQIKKIEVIDDTQFTENDYPSWSQDLIKMATAIHKEKLKPSQYYIAFQQDENNRLLLGGFGQSQEKMQTLLQNVLAAWPEKK